MVIGRGEIWWADLPAPSGSGPGDRRPVLVVQADGFNRSAIGTVVVAIITSNLRLGAAPGNVALTRADSGLPRDSVVNVSQLITLDKAELTEPVARLKPGLLRAVERGLRLVLGLEG
jgi:mRNA interferase MazF